jgi:hypothetical protein
MERLSSSRLITSKVLSGAKKVIRPPHSRLICRSGFCEQSIETKVGISSHHRIHAVSCRSKLLSPVGHRINASTKMDSASSSLSAGWSSGKRSRTARHPAASPGPGMTAGGSCSRRRSSIAIAAPARSPFLRAGAVTLVALLRPGDRARCSPVTRVRCRPARISSFEFRCRPPREPSTRSPLPRA